VRRGAAVPTARGCEIGGFSLGESAYSGRQVLTFRRTALPISSGCHEDVGKGSPNTPHPGSRESIVT
jgi:hypothetical protein